MKAPSFWHDTTPNIVASALTPFGWLYGKGTALRVRLGKTRRFGVPVICVGNLIAGGTGKTPVVISIVRHLIDKGINAHIVTRGYGGTTFGPHFVESSDLAEAVGDEAKLLARAAPTWVSDDRIKGCVAAIKERAEVIIFDDGFQDPAVEKDLSVIVVDGGYGFGNGRMIPAGPLRESVSAGMERAQAAVVIGEEIADLSLLKASGATILHADRTLGGIDEDLGARRVFAFAGIGRPTNFFDSLRAVGLTLADTRAFGDHHPYSVKELEALRRDAEELDAVLMTTEKDFVRLTPEQQRGIVSVPMSVAWTDATAFEALLDPIIKQVASRDG